MLLKSWRTFEKWDIRHKSKHSRTRNTYVRQFISQLYCSLEGVSEKVEEHLKSETCVRNPNICKQKRHTSDNPSLNLFYFEMLFKIWQKFEKRDTRQESKHSRIRKTHVRQSVSQLYCSLEGVLEKVGRRLKNET